MDRRIALGGLAFGLAGLTAAGLEGWLAGEARAGRPRLTTVRSRAAIDAPRERVWQLLADLEGQTRWMHDAKAIRLVTAGPPGAGTVAEADVRILGLTTVDPIVVTEWEAPARFGIRHLGMFTGEGLFRLEAAPGGGTVVSWDERLVAPILPHLAAVLLWPIFGRIFQADLDRLKALAEAEAAGDG